MVVKSVATLLKIRNQDLVDKETAEEVVAVEAHTIDLVVVVAAVDVVDLVEKEEKETTKSTVPPINKFCPFTYLSIYFLNREN
jgi:dTDP-4-dehydrorhamnose reductase